MNTLEIIFALTALQNATFVLGGWRRSRSDLMSGYAQSGHEPYAPRYILMAR